MEEVWLVYVVYQYDGYENTEVYSTKEKACVAADELVSELKKMRDPYVVAEGFDERTFLGSMICDCGYTRLENRGGQVEITVERKQVK